MLDASYETPVMVTGNVLHLPPQAEPSHPVSHKQLVAYILYHLCTDASPPNYRQHCCIS